MSKQTKRTILPDPVYENAQVAKLVNHIMRKGKKTVAQKIVYGAFEIIKTKTKQEPLEIFQKAVVNTSPMLEVRSKRIGGATYQVPIEVKENRREALAIHWIISAAKQKKGKPMYERLAQELIDAANNMGQAVKSRENLDRVAEANKAFAHFAWQR